MPIHYIKEILLYSGQYALFYLLMNLSLGLEHFFNNFGHIILLFSLAMQIIISTSFLKSPYHKAIASFIAPLCYTLFDGLGNNEWIYNIGHLFFWIFTFFVAILTIISTKTNNKVLKIISEALITFCNISIFIFIYFYFDLKLSFQEQLTLGQITPDQFKEALEIYNIQIGFGSFLDDPAHVFLIFGGMVLGLIITYNRVLNLQLTHKIDDLLDTFLDSSIKKRLILDHEQSEKIELVILFCDIRNFSKISEQNNASQIVDALNIYYDYWALEVAKNNGIINKFIGDAVLVIFGLEQKSLPLACQDAINTASMMIENLPIINTKLQNNALPSLDGIGIGIHCGEVIVGSIGGKDRKDFTVIGDNVNIASRIESLCKTYNAQCLLSKEVFSQLSQNKQLECKYIDDVLLKGKSSTNQIYQLHKA